VGLISTKGVVFGHTLIHFYKQLYFRREENQLDATEWFIALIICSTCFGHIYAHHQELETLCVLLLPVVCDALVVGCWLLEVRCRAAGYASGMRDVIRATSLIPNA